MQPVQLSLMPDPLMFDRAPALPALVPPAPTGGLPVEAVAVATALLAGVIAKAAVPNRIEVTGDE